MDKRHIKVTSKMVIEREVTLDDALETYGLTLDDFQREEDFIDWAKEHLAEDIIEQVHIFCDDYITTTIETGARE